MTKRKNLVITGLPDEYRQAFLDMADIMELTRDQLLILLMVDVGAVRGGFGAAITDRDAQAEWREVMVSRLFDLNNL